MHMSEPSRPSLQPEAPSVVLTGPGADQNALLVIGLDTVVSDLEPYTTLAFASTFGEARAFLDDSDPIDGHLERWLESRMTPEDDWDEGEQALVERYAGDSSPGISGDRKHTAAVRTGSNGAHPTYSMSSRGRTPDGGLTTSPLPGSPSTTGSP